MDCLLLILTILGYLDSEIIRNPLCGFAERVATCSDTSGCVLVRIIADFTGDGLRDVALSATCGWDDEPGWGNAGGTWELWGQQANEETTYCFISRIVFHPFAITVTPSDSGTILTTYHRVGARGGYLSRERLTGPSLERLEEHYVTISPDSSDTWFEDMFPVERRLRCQACRLSDLLAGEPVWVPGYQVPSESD